MQMCKIVGLRSPTMTGPRLGVEMELEEVRTVRALEEMYPSIGLKRDGSLRGERAFELVSIAPAELKPTLDLWRGVMNLLDTAPPRRSVRCSTHVHLNVMDMTIDQFFVLCALYGALEPWFIRMAGDTRAGNHFCLPWSVAPQNVKTVAALSKTKSLVDVNVRARLAGCVKYSALNTLSATGLGTVEFRMGEAFDSFERFSAWLTSINALREAATSGKLSLDDVIHITMDDPPAMAARVLGAVGFPHVDDKQFAISYANLSWFVRTRHPTKRNEPVWDGPHVAAPFPDPQTFPVYRDADGRIRVGFRPPAPPTYIAATTIHVQDADRSENAAPRDHLAEAEARILEAQREIRVQYMNRGQDAILPEGVVRADTAGATLTVRRRDR